MLVAACSPSDVPGEVLITSATCEKIDVSSVYIRAEADVSIEIGQRVAFTAYPREGGGNFTVAYTCGGWTDDVAGESYSYGCRREAGQPADAHLVFESDYVRQDEDLPVPTLIDVTPVLFAANDPNQPYNQELTTVTCAR